MNCSCRAALWILLAGLAGVPGEALAARRSTGDELRPIVVRAMQADLSPGAMGVATSAV